MKKENEEVEEGFLLAFGELFLKSKGVQKIMKRQLLNNLSLFFKKEKIDFRVYPFRERIFIETENRKKTENILRNTFGIVWFARCFFFRKKPFGVLKNFIRKNYPKWIKENETFALRIKRDSSLSLKREKIIDEIAKGIERKVNLKKPKKEIFIEGRKPGWFLYFKKKKASGGLPLKSQGRALVLVSGGIDSPVAAYLIAKRGAENIWVHFHSFPLVSKASIEKVRELSKFFLRYQPKLKILFVPFSEIQLKIKAEAPPKYRVLLYRRIMLKIAQKLAKKEGAGALVTGESLGQVSSQTLDNLKITQEAVKIPILRPLIAMDKEEIISLAKKIKTCDLSIKPQEDCCTLFVPKHQTGKGKIEVIKKQEKSLNLNKLMLKVVKNRKEETIKITAIKKRLRR